MDDPGPSGQPSPPAAETVLTSLHTLLRAHVAAHPNPSAPYLHPFAPLPPAAWKGKGRASLPGAEEQIALLRKIREAVEASRGVLGRREEERTKLARSMREVITHESALLPLGTTLLSLPPAPRPLAHLCLLPPSELLSALGRRLDLQVFAEDSQFGLLRTSLTLAGSRFVVDVDLEADSMGDESEPPTAAGTPAFPPMTPLTPFGGSIGMQLERREGLTGKTRLAKLSANHVTPSGEDGKSEWIAKVLRDLFEAHLARWNEYRDKVVDGDEAMEDLLPSARALEHALAEVKALDELAEGMGKGEPDLFADLESLAMRLVEAGVDVTERLFPSFRVVPGGPVFTLRPERKGESVPPANIVSEAVEVPAENGMNVDEEDDGVGAGIEAVLAGVDSGDEFTEVVKEPPVVVEPMCRGRWLVEVDNTTSSTSGRGIVVRRTWLLPDSVEEEAWPNSVKVEGLIYAAQLPTESPPVFPYGAEFVHPTTHGLSQHWSQITPGPEGYLVGRVGLPASWSDFGELVRVLRAQVVLDVLYASAFNPSSQRSDDGDDMTLDDLDQPPSAVPLTVTLHQRSMRVSLPLPHESDSPTLTLEFSPATAAPYVALTYESDDLNDEQRSRVDNAIAGALWDVDAVATVRRLLAAL